MAYTYLWDAPYLDFSSEAVITYKKANTSDKPKPAQFSITEGNALLSFDNPGSYRVYAVDKGIRYERTINIHKIAPSLEGSGLSEEDVERLKSDVASQVTEQVTAQVAEQVKTAIQESCGGGGTGAGPSLVYNDDGTFVLG